jgi:hypothetical protein
VKKAVAILLVLVVLLTGVPLVMAGPVMCIDCDTATAVSTCLFAVLTVSLLLAALVAARARHSFAMALSLLHASGLERPPRLV